MTTIKLWIRAGDSDNYNSFDDLEDGADYLSDVGATHPLEFCNEYGVTGTEYRGQNYISLFWGDADAQPIRSLTSNQHLHINELLARKAERSQRQS